MATCPACDFEIDVDERDVEEGDDVNCPECGESLVIASVSPLELDFAGDDEEEEEEDEYDEDDEDEEGDADDEEWEE
jgi:alpha-aminoadipate carrier protein LysW